MQDVVIQDTNVDVRVMHGVLAPARTAVAAHAQLLQRRLVLSVVLVLLSLGFVQTFSVSAHAAADPVTSVIIKAQRHHQITRGEARTYVLAWRRAQNVQRRLHRNGSASRARDIAAVQNVARSLARSRVLNADRLPAMFASINATTRVMGGHGRFPRHEQRITFPGDPLVYRYYSGRGVQIQPMFTLSDATVRLAAGDVVGARRAADAMLKLGVRRGRVALTWEYMFPYESSSPPWNSSMSQALAIQLYARLWEQQHRRTDLRAAKLALNGFIQSPKNGGVAVTQGRGRWFLIYPKNSRQRVLNGHLQALLNMHEYYRITKDSRALRLMNAGIAAVIPMLPRFDTGAWSRYQLGQEADLGYHDFMTTQLTRLGKRMEIVQFSDMAHRFSTYRTSPPQISVSKIAAAPIYPIVDGYRDATFLRFFVNKRSTVKLSLLDSSGRAVRRFTTTGGRGSRMISWNGRRWNRRAVAPGMYTVSFRAVDIVGNVRTGQLTKGLEVRKDTTPPTVLKTHVSYRGTAKSRVSVRVFDGESGWVRVAVVVGGRTVASKRGRHAGTIVLDVPRAARYVVHARIVVFDSSGNRRTVRL